MTPSEANLRAQLAAANVQIRTLERDVRELRAAVDRKTDEIERVRIILGPNAPGLARARTEAEQWVLDAMADTTRLPIELLRAIAKNETHTFRLAAVAELERRESQKAKSNV